jgi:hypothetical protein
MIAAAARPFGPHFPIEYLFNLKSEIHGIAFKCLINQ